MAVLFNILNVLCILVLIGSSHSQSLRFRTNNGLAITPPMGLKLTIDVVIQSANYFCRWNSYNHYSCSPNESIVHSNAQALIDLGLKDAGYHYITVDCGWTLPNRTANGTLTWNPARFPNGFPALGAFIHQLGLNFGAYSDGGVQMCMTGEPAQAGSLNDNCYSDAASGYPNTNYAPSVSPKSHYETMRNAILSTGRPMIFQICDWGVDFPSAWAPALGNTWRITNDIIPAWRTIPRILNQAVPQTSFAGPHQWLDLDMLEIGNRIFTTAEEETHFSLWAIIKSPLVIGTALKDSHTSITAASLAILKNPDVIGYNQDSLGVVAGFKRRWTAGGYEVWSGPLSRERTVVAVINWQDEARKLTLDFPDIGIQRAGLVKDIWNSANASNVITSYTGMVKGHGTLLLELRETTSSGQYDISDAIVSGQTAFFANVYGASSSSKYTLLVKYSKALSSDVSVEINSGTYLLAAGTTVLNTTALLLAANNNTLTVTSTPLPQSITIIPPPSVFYPSTSFSLTGNSALTVCSPSLCSPVGSKITQISPTGFASLKITSPSSSLSGAKFVEVYFCNNDIAFSTSWGMGTNTRNMTISVNGQVTRIEVPLSGKSSELFSPGKGWEDTGTFGVLTSGWIKGVNEIIIGNNDGDKGLVTWGPDLVGLGVQW